MTWNYRIVRHTQLDAPEHFAIHEVYYDELGRADSVTIEPVAAVGDTAGEVVEELEMMLRDARRQPVIDYDDIGAPRE